MIIDVGRYSRCVTLNRRNGFRTLLAALLVLVFAAGGAVAATRPNAALHEDEIEWCWPWSDEQSRHDLGGAPPAFAFPATKLGVIVELALGADLTASPDTWVWTDITSYVRHKDRIVIFRGRGDEWTETGPSIATLTLDNRDGRFTRLNPLGTWYGQIARNTPLRIRVDMLTGAGPQTRFTGFVTKWPPRWDKSGNNKWTPITADGIFRRLGQGDPLRSPMFRTYSGTAPDDYRPHVYYPLEDASSSTIFGSGIPDQPSVQPTGTVTFAANTDLIGSDSLASFAANATATFPVASYTNTGHWLVMVSVKVPSEPAAAATYVEVRSSGTGTYYRLSVTPGSPATVDFNVYDSANTLINGVSYSLDGVNRPSESDFFGKWFTYPLMISEDTADPPVTPQAWSGIANGKTLTGVGMSAIGLTGAVTGSAQKITLYGASTGASFGHLGLWKDALSTTTTANITEVERAVQNNLDAVGGYAGEQADARIARLCREDRLPYSITGTRSAPMGAQPIAKLLDLFREAEKADVGILYETLDGRVGYRTNADRYNRDVLFTLDYGQKVVREWTPEDDDQLIRNDVTVSRPSGSYARVEDAASIARDGRYKQPWSANTETDSQLDDIAGWLKRKGTWDELRFPMVEFQLHRHTGLINAWLAQDLLTQRFDLTNLPTPIPTPTEQSLEAYQETLGSVDWEVTAVLAPSGPYEVGSLGDIHHPGAWLQTGTGTKLAAQLASGATSVSVTVDGALFSTTANLTIHPMSLLVGGEVLPVSAISGGSSPQTFTVTRTLAKTHAVNAPVKIHQPLILAP